MKIQKTTDYAIRILRYLHQNANSGEVLTASAIADALRISYPHFIKLANPLKKNGLIISVQGRRGGYRLAARGHESSVYDIFLAIEGHLRISPYTDARLDTEQCHVREYFLELEGQIINMMRQKKIADFDGAA